MAELLGTVDYRMFIYSDGGAQTQIVSVKLSPFLEGLLNPGSPAPPEPPPGGGPLPDPPDDSPVVYPDDPADLRLKHKVGIDEDKAIEKIAELIEKAFGVQCTSPRPNELELAYPTTDGEVAFTGDPECSSHCGANCITTAKHPERYNDNIDFGKLSDIINVMLSFAPKSFFGMHRYALSVWEQSSSVPMIDRVDIASGRARVRSIRCLLYGLDLEARAEWARGTSL